MEGLKSVKRSEKNERDGKWVHAVGADYLLLWRSQGLHEANIKATAGGKGQAETRTAAEKGNEKCKL